MPYRSWELPAGPTLALGNGLEPALAARARYAGVPTAAEEALLPPDWDPIDTGIAAMTGGAGLAAKSAAAAGDMTGQAFLNSSLPWYISQPAALAAGVAAGRLVPAEAANMIPGEAAIKTLHVSPARFDTPTLKFAGSGEGNAAFGYGLYSAENPAVHQHYTKLLAPSDSTPATKRILGGIPYAHRNVKHSDLEHSVITDGIDNWLAQLNVDDSFKTVQLSPSAAANLSPKVSLESDYLEYLPKDIRNEYRQYVLSQLVPDIRAKSPWVQEAIEQDPVDFLRFYASSEPEFNGVLDRFSDQELAVEIANKLHNQYTQLHPSVEFVHGPSGIYRYKWALEGDPHTDYLTLDTPLKDQPEIVKKLARGVDKTGHPLLDVSELQGQPNATGELFHESLRDNYSGPPGYGEEDVSEVLHRAGVLGVRFKDGFTRYTDDPGSFNYVSFSPFDIQIEDVQGPFTRENLPRSGKWAGIGAAGLPAAEMLFPAPSPTPVPTPIPARR